MGKSQIVSLVYVNRDIFVKCSGVDNFDGLIDPNTTPATVGRLRGKPRAYSRRSGAVIFDREVRAGIRKYE